MRRNLLIACLFTITAGSLLIAQQDQRQVQGQPVQMGGTQGKAMDPQMDIKYLQGGYKGNLFEIEESKIAAEKADNTQVKQFAQMMVDEHTRANQQLKEVAQRKNVQLPDQLDPWMQAKLEHCRTLEPEILTIKYMFGQVGMHESCILMNRYVMNMSRDQDIKTFAQKMLPDLRKHQQNAQRIADDLIGGGERQALNTRAVP